VRVRRTAPLGALVSCCKKSAEFAAYFGTELSWPLGGISLLRSISRFWCSLVWSCVFCLLFDLVEDSCEVGSLDVWAADVVGDFLAAPFLVEGRASFSSSPVEQSTPAGLWFGEVFRDLLGWWDGEVGCEVSLEGGLAGVPREVVFDPVALQDVEGERVIGEPAINLSCLLREGLVLLVEFSSDVAIHDDDCLSTAVEPALWLCCHEEVGTE